MIFRADQISLIETAISPPAGAAHPVLIGISILHVRGRLGVGAQTLNVAEAVHCLAFSLSCAY
jgi:hypothetical protein